MDDKLLFGIISVAVLVGAFLANQLMTKMALRQKAKNQIKRDHPTQQENTPLNPKSAEVNRDIKEIPKQKTPLVTKLTLNEKIELSWQFLYEMTEIVLNKFSPEDRDAVHDIGIDLYELGMRYEHVIDFGIRQEKSFVKAKEQEKTQEKVAQI